MEIPESIQDKGGNCLVGEKFLCFLDWLQTERGVDFGCLGIEQNQVGMWRDRRKNGKFGMCRGNVVWHCKLLGIWPPGLLPGLPDEEALKIEHWFKRKYRDCQGSIVPNPLVPLEEWERASCGTDGEQISSTASSDSRSPPPSLAPPQNNGKPTSAAIPPAARTRGVVIPPAASADDIAERERLRAFVRAQYHGFASRSEFLWTLFPERRLDPFFDQWMHDLQPLNAVQHAASVAVTISRRMMDVMLLRIELHAFPKVITDQFQGPSFDEFFRDPQQFDDQGFQEQADLLWDKLETLARDHGIARTLTRPSGAFGSRRPENGEDIFRAARWFCTKETEPYRQALESARGGQPTYEQWERDELHAEAKRIEAELKYAQLDWGGGAVRTRINDFHRRFNENVAKQLAGQEVPLPENDPRYNEIVHKLARESAPFLMLIALGALAVDVEDCFAEQLHRAMLRDSPSMP